MRAICFIACLLLASTPAYASSSNSKAANTSASKTSLPKQRQLYLAAIRDIHNGNSAAANRLAAQLTDYPLYPYIEYTAKMDNLKGQSAKSILSFRNRYKNLPIAEQLMQNWVYSLAKQREWGQFLKYYDLANFSGRSSACYYAYALYREGHKTAAFAEARKLWLVNYSQPNECDRIFQVWHDSNSFDRKAAWQRYAMSMRAGDTSLASYLKRFLTGKDRRLADEYTRVKRDPGVIKQYGHFKRNDVRTNRLVLYGISRLAFQHPEAAFRTLAHYSQTHHFTAHELRDAYTHIGRHLALDGDPDNLLDSLPLDMSKNEALTQARIRLALRQLDWNDVLVFINLLPQEAQASHRWRYWKARVLLGSSDQADQAAAKTLFGQLATTRSFYGFMAADTIGASYNFDDSPIDVDPAEVHKFEALPGIRRAFELFTLNQRNSARREWHFVTRSFDHHQFQVAARAAQKWGWSRQAIGSMISARAWNDLDIRFPLAYYDTFEASARTWDIPPQWSIAVARQESAFMPDARSPAGALGIMQLMPPTARETAQRQRLHYSGPQDLDKPIANIRIGSAYLGKLLRKFDNNRVIASAAYNAGPYRVSTWIDPSLPLDVWIETLPFKSTRQYVENVLMFTAIYSRRLGQSQPLVYQHELNDFSNEEVTFNNTTQTGEASSGGQ